MDDEDVFRRIYGDELVDRAKLRKVSRTQWGWRVEYDKFLDGRYELDKSDGKPRAYWPTEQDDGSWRCRCRHGRVGKICSHILAVELRLSKDDIKSAEETNGAQLRLWG